MVIQSIEAIELSNPAEESPYGIMGSGCSRCNCCCRSHSRAPRLRCRHGLLGRVPLEQFGHIGRTFEIGTGLYLICVAMIASSIGGYIAGRLRTKWAGVHTHEVFFRDTAHGFLVWGLATVLSAAFLAAAASNIAGGASSAGVTAIQSAGSGGPVDYYADTLLRSKPGASPNTTVWEPRATRSPASS